MTFPFLRCLLLSSFLSFSAPFWLMFKHPLIATTSGPSLATAVALSPCYSRLESYKATDQPLSHSYRGSDVRHSNAMQCDAMQPIGIHHPRVVAICIRCSSLNPHVIPWRDMAFSPLIDQLQNCAIIFRRVKIGTEKEAMEKLHALLCIYGPSEPHRDRRAASSGSGFVSRIWSEMGFGVLERRALTDRIRVRIAAGDVSRIASSLRILSPTPRRSQNRTVDRWPLCGVAVPPPPPSNFRTPTQSRYLPGSMSVGLLRPLCLCRSILRVIYGVLAVEIIAACGRLEMSEADRVPTQLCMALHGIAWHCMARHVIKWKIENPYHHKWSSHMAIRLGFIRLSAGMDTEEHLASSTLSHFNPLTASFPSIKQAI